MEHQKRLNLLNKRSDCNFVARNWIIVNDESNANYSVSNKIIYSTELLNLIFAITIASLF